MTTKPRKDSTAPPVVKAHWRRAPMDPAALQLLLRLLFAPEVEQDEGRRRGDADGT
jgi:hypothetical protein